MQNPLAQRVIPVPVLLTQKEVADILGVSTKWLERDRWVGARIPYVKIGRGVRYRAGDIAAYIEASIQVA